MISKKCSCCKYIKEIIYFSKCSKNKDGLSYICKDCVKIKRQENSAHYKAYEAKRCRDPERKRKHKEYKKTYIEKHRPEDLKVSIRKSRMDKSEKAYRQSKTKTKNNNAYRKRYPERELARSRLNDAVRYGKIVRPNNCVMCGVTCIPEAHHYDYSKPLEVLWLCSKCHHEVHKKLKGENGENCERVTVMPSA